MAKERTRSMILWMFVLLVTVLIWGPDYQTHPSQRPLIVCFLLSAVAIGLIIRWVRWRGSRKHYPPLA